MNCFVYRSNTKSGMFLYLIDKDDFSCVPESLLTLLGDISYSFDFDLNKDKKLVKNDAYEVMKSMSENGFYLQMPPPKTDFLGIK